MSSKLENKLMKKSISKLYLDSPTSDILFAFNDDECDDVPAHKSILAAASAVFDRMFYGPMKEKDIVEIKDASPNGFKEFLQFFYLPEITLTMENIEEVARLADKYDIPDGINSCADFIESRLTDDNMIWGYQLALSLQYENLEKICKKRIATFTKDAFSSDIFLNCGKTVLEQILRLDLLCCGEIDLFYACVEWAKMSCRKDGLDEQDPINLRNQLGDCFHLISVGVMKSEEIGNIISNELLERMFSRDELRDLLQMKTVKNFQSNIFKYRRGKWDFKETVKCGLVVKLPSDNSSLLQAREPTVFSTNRLILLTGFECIEICPGGYNVNEIDTIVTITEYSDLLFSPNLPTNVLCDADPLKFRSTGNITDVSLHQPVEIQPNKFYEIRLRFKTHTGDLYHRQRLWHSKVNVDGLTIKIHRHPSSNNNRWQTFWNGTATALHFYQKLNSN